mmetsp:Transcript_26667/g.54588  ORF Transcript_26667/g.54588 Transcript_26667/m.54588 type:complete len:95 (-) Transcript_26667:106-390(-)
MPSAWQSLVALRLNLVRRAPLPREQAEDRAAVIHASLKELQHLPSLPSQANSPCRFEMWISKGATSFEGAEHTRCTCQISDSGFSESKTISAGL